MSCYSQDEDFDPFQVRLQAGQSNDAGIVVRSNFQAPDSDELDILACVDGYYAGKSMHDDVDDRFSRNPAVAILRQTKNMRAVVMIICGIENVDTQSAAWIRWTQFVDEDGISKFDFLHGYQSFDTNYEDGRSGADRLYSFFTIGRRRLVLNRCTAIPIRPLFLGRCPCGMEIRTLIPAG